MNVLDVDFASLTHAVATYGYPVLFVLVVVASAGAPLPVGILLAGLGAASAQSGGPNFALLVASGLAASVVGDGVDFGIGRVGGRRAILWAQARLRNSRWLGPAARLGKLPRLEAMVFLSRFAMTALATPASLVAGATGMAAGAFLFWDAAGEAVFVVGNLTLGRFLSASGLSSGPLVLALGVLAVVSYAVIYALGRRKHERRAGAPALRAPVTAVTAPAAPSAQARQVAASRRIVCDMLTVTPSAACGTR